MTANTPSSKRQKGNRAEKQVAEAYRHYKVDETARRMPMSGGGYHKGDIWKLHDYAYVDEVKCQETVKFWAWWEQAQSQVSGSQTPVLHITANHRPIVTVLSLETYMQLRACEKQLNDILRVQEKNPN